MLKIAVLVLTALISAISGLSPLEKAAEYLILSVFANSHFIDDYRLCNDSTGFPITLNVSGHSSISRFRPCGRRPIANAEEGMNRMQYIVGSLFPWAIPCRLTHEISVTVGPYTIRPCLDYELFDSLLTVLAQRHANSTCISAFRAKAGSTFPVDVVITDIDNMVAPRKIQWSLHTEDPDTSHTHQGLTKDLNSLKVFVCIGHYMKYFRKRIRIVLENSYVLQFTCTTDVIEKPSDSISYQINNSSLNRTFLYVFFTLAVLVLFLGVIKVSWPGKRWC